MKKQLVIIGIIAILITVGLSGCNQESTPLKSDKDKFVGTWKVTDEMNVTYFYTFFSNGTFTQSTWSRGTYEIKDGKLISIYSEGNVITNDYYFSNSDKTLKLVPSGVIGHSLILTKQ